MYSLAKIRELCLQVKGNEEPLQVLLLSCKVKTECNSQIVLFSCQFQSQVQCTSDNTPCQCDGFTCINSVGV